MAMGWSALLNSTRYGLPPAMDSRSEPNRNSTAARFQMRPMPGWRASENGTETPTMSMNDGQITS